MNRIINNPDEVVADSVRGFQKAFSSTLELTDNPRVLKSTSAPRPGRVGIVTGGGSGHDPAFIGYIGENFLDAVAIGEVFSSPTAKSFFDAFKAVDGGTGVACLYGNYAGDNMNVKMAVRLAEREGITVKTVVAKDDVASAKKDEADRRRGVAGEILMWKVGAARAAEGGSLEEVIASAQKAIDNTRSVGIGLSPCTIAAVGKPNFEIKDGEMEVGIGHHGEPGIEVTKIESADKMARRMLDVILPDLPFKGGDEVTVLISGLGATPIMELYIFYDTVAEILQQQGIKVVQPLIGNLFTSLEMNGVTLTVMRLDEELRRLMLTPASSPGLVWTEAMRESASRGPRATAAREGATAPAKTGEKKASSRVAGKPSGDAVDALTAGKAVIDLVAVINKNRDYLSELDGKIGDGDHGINMSTGFTRFGELVKGEELDLSEGFDALGTTLLHHTGGSLGPLYGALFMDMGQAARGKEAIDAATFDAMLAAGQRGVEHVGGARPGDKTLLDTIVPAVAAFHEAHARGASFKEALRAFSAAAEKGRDSTRDMVARIGRASRLGERSRGVLDAGASSTCVILQSLARSLEEMLP